MLRSAVTRPAVTPTVVRVLAPNTEPPRKFTAGAKRLVKW